MKSEPSGQYWGVLTKEFNTFGLERVGSVALNEKLSGVDSRLSIEKWTGDEYTFLISHGCSMYLDARNHGDEFIVEIGDYESVATTLLTYVMYFHLTHRHVLPSDCLEIGKIAENPEGYSHIFVSVPYFFPATINFITADNARFSLNWLMPIYADEERFIREHGTDNFEQRLLGSGYGFFDRRRNYNYLLNSD